MEELLKEIIEKLKNKNWHISFAESITGGLCASTLISIGGASKVISESLVTYSNEAKMKYLNVSSKTIDKYTVVSEEVAKEMAEGLNKLTKSEVCVSLTGLAGPEGDGINPVGLVCFGLDINGDVKTFKNVFSGDRNEIRNKAMKYIFEEINKAL